MRSVQGHTGGEQINPRLQNNVFVPYVCSDDICHVGSPNAYRSICDLGLFAGGLGFRKGRQTCFFTTVDPTVATMLTSRFEENEPRTILCQLKCGPMHNAVHWFVLRLAQNKGLEFWQTINHAIILYCSMPAECLVKIVKRNLDDTEADILHEKKNNLNQENFLALC